MRNILIIAIIVIVTGCATIPPGPSVMVLPANGRPFEVFQADDAICRAWAEKQTGWNANKTVNENLVGGAIAGGALGAAAGALIGAASGNVGPGAAIGAGVGLLGGAALGAGEAGPSGREVQRRYDNAYQQCMYSKGNQISGQSQMAPPPPPQSGPQPQSRWWPNY